MAPSSRDQPFPPGRMPGDYPSRVAIVGGGRLGWALASALRAAGLTVAGPLGRDEAPEPCDAVILCVPDAEIAAAAAAAAFAAPLIGHTSGATPLTTLAAGPAPAAFGLHPLQTLTGSGAPDPLTGAGCAIGGETDAALAAARFLAEAAGMLPFELADADRAAYHAAASIASNFTVTLQAAAERVAAGAGIGPDRARALLAPLVRTTIENWVALGPERALTGPVARGDEATVQRQREAVAKVAPELSDLFDELVQRTHVLAAAPSLQAPA